MRCAALVLLIALAGCGAAATGPTTDGYPLTVQNCGREVSFEQPPERVLAIGGEAATMIHAAGAADRISTFGPVDGEPLGAAEADLADIPRIEVPGSGEVPREAIIAEQPDLVVTFGLNETSPDDLAAAGIATLVVSGRCDEAGAPQQAGEFSPLAAMYADIELYGRILGTSDRAAASVVELRARVDAARDRVATTGPSTAAALFVTGPDSPLGAYGGLSMAGEQLTVLGLDNVFADTPQRYFEPSVESLIARDPDLLLALYQASDNTAAGTRDTVAGRGELAGVSAVQDQLVLAIDFFYSGNGVLAVDGLEQLARQLANG